MHNHVCIEIAQRLLKLRIVQEIDQNQVFVNLVLCEIKELGVSSKAFGCVANTLGIVKQHEKLFEILGTVFLILLCWNRNRLVGFQSQIFNQIGNGNARQQQIGRGLEFSRTHNDKRSVGKSGSCRSSGCHIAKNSVNTCFG